MALNTPLPDETRLRGRACTLAWMPRSTRCWLAERSKSPRIRLWRIREYARADVPFETEAALGEAAVVALGLDVLVVERDRVVDHDAADVVDHRLEVAEAGDEHVVGLDADEIPDGATESSGPPK